MALSLRSLVRLAHQTPIGLAAGTPSDRLLGVLLYGTDDAAATVEAAGYFNGARAFLRVGDIITAVMAAAGTPVLKQLVVLTVPASGNVTVGLQTTTAG
jgi:hypothetical protein